MTNTGESTVTEAPDEASPPPNEVYFVRMAMNITAPSPSDAVVGLIDQFVEHGLRNWTYRVDVKRDGELPEFVGFFDGYGEIAEVNVTEDDDDSDEDSDERPITEVDLPAVDDDNTSADASKVDSEDLTAYAESLNQD